MRHVPSSATLITFFEFIIVDTISPSREFNDDFIHAADREKNAEPFVVGGLCKIGMKTLTSEPLILCAVD